MAMPCAFPVCGGGVRRPERRAVRRPARARLSRAACSRIRRDMRCLSLSGPLPLAAALSVLALVAGCSAPRIVPAAPAPAVPVPAPAPAPVATPSGDWLDWPVTPGDWSWRQVPGGSIASFGMPGAAPLFSMRCEQGHGRIQLTARITGQAVAPGMTIRTTSTLRTLEASETRGSEQWMVASVRAHDRLLDAMGYSRGRFVVALSGERPLVLPAWSEVLRVVEDCRR